LVPSLTRRSILLGVSASFVFASDALACHTYESPEDGLKGCGAYRRDQRNGVSGNRRSTSTASSAPKVESSGGGTCIGSGDVTLTKPGTYKGCGKIGLLKIAGPDILVTGVHARRIVFDGATRSRVTGSVVDAEKKGGGIYIANSSNITFDNNKIINVVGMGADIRPQKLKGLIIRNNHFSGIRRAGAGKIGRDHGSGITIGHYWKDSTPNINPEIVVEGNRFDNFDLYGDALSAIKIKSNYVIIRNNIIDADRAVIFARHGYGVQILNNTLTGKTDGINIMGDNHVVNGNTTPRIRLFGGQVTMDDYSRGKVTRGGIYPVARNIKLDGNSVGPSLTCWGSCSYKPTYSGR
jgi:parallel beta-helix repeat protein